MHWSTPEDRRKLGQARRKQAGRQQHDKIETGARPALALIARATRGRTPALLRLRLERMSASPFAFFRGAAAVMAADLSRLPATGLLCQLCGDAHVRNLGAYAAPDGRLVFDLNDFDETAQGPFEWDLKRMAASLVLAGREAGHKDAAAEQAARLCVERYAALMRQFSRMPMLEAARYSVHRIGAVEPVHAALLKAERATPAHLLEKLTEPSSAQPGAPRRFREEKPELSRLPARQAAEVLAALADYRETLPSASRHLLDFYRPVEAAAMVSGLGSLGLRNYCVYLEGNGARDALFLQIKEAGPSVYAPYLPESGAARHSGQRVVEGQRAMQLASDPLLGWTRIAGRDCLVRQRNDHKGSIDLEDLAGSGLEAYAEICGELLARGHARSGDPVAISGYIGAGGGLSESVAAFGLRYAEQTEKDWKTMQTAKKPAPVKAKPPAQP